jgi:hypothetical protein
MTLTKNLRFMNRNKALYYYRGTIFRFMNRKKSRDPGSRTGKNHVILDLRTPHWVKYSVFARISALCQARVIFIPTMHMGSLHSITPMRMVGIVVILARHSAKI